MRTHVTVVGEEGVMKREPEEHVSEEEKEELLAEAEERNPDPITRREALELELMEEDRSEAGEEIGDEID